MGSAPAHAGAYRIEYRTFAAGRTLESGANFCEAEAKFRHRATQSVAMHPQLLGRLALVASISDKHFAKVLSSEFANGVVVFNAA